jgi:two-component system nitrate/nitrite response regulator NarL
VGQSPATPRTVTVAVVDDHQVVLEGVRSWIARDPMGRVELVAAGQWVDSVLSGPGATADVLVLDLMIFGHSVVDRVAALAGQQRVVVFSADATDDTIRGVLDAGASAYLTKHEGPEHFLATIVSVAADRPYVTPSVARAMLGDQGPARPELSQQESRALRLWFQQPKKQSVAREMGIALDTVDQYINRARIKYAAAGRPAPNKAAMVARAIEDGLIRPEDVR